MDMRKLPFCLPQVDEVVAVEDLLVKVVSILVRKALNGMVPNVLFY
jgi:hypothetical protein